MGRWQNFSIWRGRLPHWRANDVNYYVTFRHRRPLDESECNILFSNIFRAQRSRFDFIILCVLPEQTEMVFTVREGPSGDPYELSDVVEKGKRKAGTMITKKSGERYPPFYAESYDRIVRDDAELETTWNSILASPVEKGHTSEPEEWPYLYVLDAPPD